MRGKAESTVTLVEYGDLECSYCGQAEPIIRELPTVCDDDLRYVFRHLPLSDVHLHAQMAAEAVEAAGTQGAFWEMRDLLSAHQDALTPLALSRYAESLGLNMEGFSEDLRQRRHAPRVSTDVASTDLSGVSGTPTFFVNGRRHHGVYEVAALTAAIRFARSAMSVSEPD